MISFYHTYLGFVLVTSVASFVGGWYLHTLYLRTLYKTMQSARRQMRGGAKRRRRLWNYSDIRITSGRNTGAQGKASSKKYARYAGNFATSAFLNSGVVTGNGEKIAGSKKKQSLGAFDAINLGP